MRKPVFCICENKNADQRLCFRYTDSTIPLLSNPEISSIYPYYVAVQPGLCWTRSETPKTGFLTKRLKWYTHTQMATTAQKLTLITSYIVGVKQARDKKVFYCLKFLASLIV